MVKKNLNIFEVQSIQNYIEEQEKNQQNITGSLTLLSDQYTKFRKIKGDGNCFYRSFAFLYLMENPCRTFEKTFPRTDWNYQKRGSSISSNQEFQERLHSTWIKYIHPLEKLKQEQKQNRLVYLFNEIGILDQILIGYFRSFNYYHLSKRQSRQKFQRYEQNNRISFDDFINSVRIFGTESDNFQIANLAQALSFPFIILSISTGGFHPEKIPNINQQIKRKFCLLYRPGHYDIIYRQDNYVNSAKNISSSTLNKKKEAKIEQNHNVSMMSKFMSPGKNQDSYNRRNTHFKETDNNQSQKEMMLKKQVNENGIGSGFYMKYKQKGEDEAEIDSYPKVKKEKVTRISFSSEGVERFWIQFLVLAIISVLIIGWICH